MQRNANAAKLQTHGPVPPLTKRGSDSVITGEMFTQVEEMCKECPATCVKLIAEHISGESNLDVVVKLDREETEMMLELATLDSRLMRLSSN